MADESQAKPVSRQTSLHSYDREYAFASCVGRTWAPEKLTSMLWLLMLDCRRSEETWGAIDAFADILIQHNPRMQFAPWTETPRN